MREKRNHTTRTKVLSTDSPRRTVFFVYEGTKTEEIYFDALISKQIEIGISSLVRLVSLDRSFVEEGWSNPKKLAERVELIVNERITGKISYESLIISLIQYLIDEKLISGPIKGTIFKTLTNICKNHLKVDLKEDIDDVVETTKYLLRQLPIEVNIENIANSILSIIEETSFLYDPEIDTVCLIVDRDRESFIVNDSQNQYEDVLNICRRQKFRFCITNPCFEFWLLLHFDNCVDLDRNKLLENPYVNGGHQKRYTEAECKKRMRYKKSSYDADTLVENIDKAISNEKMFCEDEEKLENQVGSNIGLLIEQLRKE